MRKSALAVAGHTSKLNGIVLTVPPLVVHHVSDKGAQELERITVAERGRRVPIGERVTQAHLDHFCPGGAGLPVTDSGPIGLGPVGDPPAGSEARAARTACQPCARCGNLITPAQDARRRITGTWVHETCPPATSARSDPG